MSQVHVEHWDNGLTVLLEPLDRPAATLHLLLPVGGATDPVGSEGAATMLHHFAERGAGGRDTRALNEALDALGARRAGGAGRDGTTWTCTSLAGDFAEAAALVADSVRRPHLGDEAFEPCRELVRQELAGLDDDPGQKALVELIARYFPGDFGRPLLGSPASLDSLSAQALRESWTRSYRPQGATLAIAGGLKLDEARALALRLFGDWEGTPPALPPATPAAAASRTFVQSETQQVHLAVAYADVAPRDPQRYHAQLAVQVLSGGMGARLFTEVREKRGLCYSVGAGNQAVDGHGYVIARAGTTTERSSETLAVLLGELTRLPGTVEPDEVDRAKVRLLANLVMSDESTSARCARRANDWHLLGRVRELDDVRAAVERIDAAGLNEHLEAHPPSEFTIVALGTQFDWPTA